MRKGRSCAGKLSEAVRVNVSPLTIEEWRQLLNNAGFKVDKIYYSSMCLLEPGRLIKDEGFGGMIKLMYKVFNTPGALRRILELRKLFRNYKCNLKAICMVAVKIQ